MKTFRTFAATALAASLLLTGSTLPAQEYDDDEIFNNDGIYDNGESGAFDDSGIFDDEGWGADNYGTYDNEYEWETDDESFDQWYGESDEGWLDGNFDLF